jgi:hypothetical protein
VTVVVASADDCFTVGAALRDLDDFVADAEEFAPDAVRDCGLIGDAIPALIPLVLEEMLGAGSGSCSTRPSTGRRSGRWLTRA